MRLATARIAGEELELDLVDVVLESGDDRLVLVDDLVDDRVQHAEGSALEKFWSALQARAHPLQIGRLRVADGDHEVRADEDVHLAELDGLVGVHVARRTQDDEPRLGVAVELRPLMAR